VAFTAELTGVLQRAAELDEKFAVLIFDLDRFKEINDVFGHAAGDGLLRELSRRVQSVIGDAYLARLGGDEFMIIQPDDRQPDSAADLAERLGSVVAEDIIFDGHHLRVGLSIGIALFPDDGRDVGSLLGNADAALYRAKADGRGTVRFFEANMDQKLRESRLLQHDLRRAISQNELALHYQPQARIDGEVVGFEALLRWHHPVRGLIQPNTFIPIAEESGLIIGIGEWVLRQACREAATWLNPLQIAVNLSPVQFKHGDLPAMIHEILLETGLAAQRLELEITEGVLIEDFQRAIAILRRLKALGVRIAMDDFGTGYSSLSYLQAFPFDKIKIDQSFIANLDSNEQSATIVRSVIGLAHGLRLPVVAEGVETASQLEFLTDAMCTKVQGFFVGRPKPMAHYSKVVRRVASRKVEAVDDTLAVAKAG
jgi:diguanylate cyclase (GGDEF)-like protein